MAEIVIGLNENTRPHKSPSVGLWAGGPDTVAPLNSTEGFLLSGRIFPVAMYGSLVFIWSLLPVATLWCPQNRTCLLICHSQYQVWCRGAVGPLGALGEKGRAEGNRGWGPQAHSDQRVHRISSDHSWSSTIKRQFLLPPSTRYRSATKRQSFLKRKIYMLKKYFKGHFEVKKNDKPHIHTVENCNGMSQAW